jgi:hypothetical protein
MEMGANDVALRLIAPFVLGLVGFAADLAVSPLAGPGYSASAVSSALGSGFSRDMRPR